MDIGEGIKPGKYELFGLAVVVINVICIIIMFIILKDDLLKAILVMVLQIVVMVVSSMPFFYLQDVAERVDRLELATYNNFCNTSELAKVKSSYPSESSEDDFNELHFDDNTADILKSKKYVKTFIDIEKWQCSCGRINQYKIDACACGEKRPQYKKFDTWHANESECELKDDCWRCTCGKINQRYVGTCACGEKRPR